MTVFTDSEKFLDPLTRFKRNGASPSDYTEGPPTTRSHPNMATHFYLAHPSRAGFQSTQWSIVLRAGELETEESRGALEQLCSVYWYPLYAFARRKGLSQNDAMDIVQGFFAHLLEKGGLASVSPQKGRFRGFLLASLKNFIANQWRKERSQRRGGRVQTLSIDHDDFEQQYQNSMSDNCTPDTLFDRCWVRTLLSHVIDQLELDYRKAGRIEIFTALCPYLTGGLPREKVSRELAMSEPAVAMSLHRMRKRYGEILRRAVADTVPDGSDVEDEVARLMEIVARG